MSYIKEFSFSKETIDETVANKRLLTMEIEFSLSCNYRCPYCYVTDNGVPEGEMTRAEIRSVLRQAKELGSRKIIILGGEPLLYPEIFEMIDFISELGMEVEMFTNGSLVTPEAAKKLYDAKVKVVLKLNSFDPEIQEKLTNEKDALGKSMTALDNLRKAGYPDKERLLAVSSVLTTLNIDEAPALWRWLRDRNIEPYFETITPQGNAKENKELMPSNAALRKVFFDICDIDAKEYDRHWEPQPPLVGERCMRHQHSCLVTSTGKVFPCVGIPESIGDIRKSSLADILADSEIVCNLKNYRELIKGPCASCDKNESCYGCRGSAYQLTGDYLASDPMCWHNGDKLDQIDILPISAEGLLPHQTPVLLLNRLLEQGERTGVLESIIRKDNIWLTPENKLSRLAYIEMAAQSTAVLDSFMHRKKVSSGMLIAAKNIVFHGDAEAGDTLRIEIFRVFSLNEFGVIGAKIFNNGKLVMEGEFKIWQDQSSL